MYDTRQSFWTELNERIKQRPNTPLQETRRADSENDNWRPQRHLADSVSYCFNLRLRQNEIMVYMIARENTYRKAIFDHLRAYQDQIEAEFEELLEWRPSDGKYKLILRRDADIERKKDQWEEYQAWLIDRAERLYFNTAPYLAGFDPE